MHDVIRHIPTGDRLKMLISILGPLRVVDDDGFEESVSQPKRRAFIAVLSAHANESLAIDRIAELAWGSNFSASPGTVRTYAWVLRKQEIFKARISHDRSGYRLMTRSGEIDVDNFVRLAEAGANLLQKADPERAMPLLLEALSLWRNPLLDDIPQTLGMSRFRERLLAERANVQDAYVAARLMLGQHQQVIGFLKDLLSQEPTREHSWAQLMIAQYRSGMRADALAAFTAIRNTLREEYGIDPGPELRHLHRQMLCDAPELWCALNPNHLAYGDR